MTKRNRQKTFPIYAVLIVMVVGLALRLYGIEWGLPTPAHPNYSYHPDELPTLVWAHWLSKGAIIQQQFVYGGTLYFSILNSFVYFGEVLADLLPGINLWADSILFGRYAMTAIALITILLVYRIGKELCDERVGIAAAASLAIFPAHIVWAQCVRVDEIAAFFVALIFLLAVKILHGNKRDGVRYYIYSGIALGAAIATRFPLGIFGVALVVAHVVNKQHARFALGAALLDRRLVVMCLCVAAAFCVLSPHIFFYFGTFVEGIRFSLSYQAPAFPDAVGRGPVFFQYLWRILPQAVGYPLFVLALLGIVIAAYRRGRENVLVLSVMIPYLLVLGFAGWLVVRYALPLVPVFALLAAYALFYLVDLYPRWKIGIYVIAGFAAGVTIVADLAYLKVAAGTDVRDMASQWIQENVETGSTVVTIQGYVGDNYFNPVITNSHKHLTFLLRPDGGGGDSQALLRNKQNEYLVLNEFVYKDMFRLGEGHPFASYREFRTNLLNSPYQLVREFKNPIEMFGIDFARFFTAFDYAIVNPGIQIYRRN